MEKGDIAGGIPVRVWVNYALILVEQKEEYVEKKLWKSVKKTRTYLVPDIKIINALWQWSVRHSCMLDLFVCQPADVKSVEKIIDEMAYNPFAQIFSVENVYEVMKKVPYRPDVVGVIDLPERGLVYGSKFIEPARIGM